MFLLDRDSNNLLRLTEFSHENTPPYAILSHTWGSEEVTFGDVQNGAAQDKLGYKKIQFCLDRAKAVDLRYCWVDTCCINRADYAELQTAINSMFKWYQQASKCFAYLADVPDKPFKNSRWFTRGWTLQELIAPANVEFFSSDGALLGDKRSMPQLLEKVTGISVGVLEGHPLSGFSFDERIGWISLRRTKYEEDLAYSLFGILQLSMVVNYGEGKKRAFDRLREEFERGASSGPYNEIASKCLRAWRLTDPREDRSRIRAGKDPLLEGSCDWVFRDPAFSNWWDNDDTPVLWIHGDPGKGKTMIMMALTDEVSRRLRSTRHQGMLSFFFCQNTIPELSNATAIVRGLTFLLAEENASLRSYAIRKHEVAGEKLFEGFNVLQSMWATLMDMAQDLSVSRLYLLVDALDECNSKSLQEFLSLLAREAPASKKIKWILSSRNTTFIQGELIGQSWKHDTSLELNPSHVTQAVNSFIDMRVNQLTVRKGYSEDLQRKVKKHLKAHAESTFLWVALICKELDKVPARRTEGAVKQFPAGLEPLYQRMLQQVTDDNNQEDAVLCEAILQAITITYRPLDQSELGFITGLDDILAVDPQAIDDLVKSCGSFLAIRDQKVYFVHQSAKDFFTTGGGKAVFRSGHKEAHSQLTKRLLKIMALSLKKDICNTGKPSVMLIDIDPKVIQHSLPLHAQYACCYWANHAVDGRLLYTDIQLIERFFDRQFLFWLEALGVHGRVADALQSLDRLWSVLGDRLNPRFLRLDISTDATSTVTNLRKFLQDALRFVRFCRSGIEAAPLQVYSSGLAFAPSNCLVRQRYNDYIPGWIALLPIVEEEWSACLQTLEGHLGSVTAVAFSPDGQTVASGSNDNTVKLWDAATGSLRSTLDGHSDSVTTVTFSPDGQTVASGSTNNIVKLWDAATGSLRSTLDGHSDSVTTVTFSPDGQTVASGSLDNTVKLWDPATGSLRRTLDGHSWSVNAVAFSPDGQTVASGSLDNTVRLWDPATGSLRSTLNGHSGLVNAVAFSPDGQTVASGSQDNTVKLWDPATESLRSTLYGHSGLVLAVAFSPDGQTVASGSFDKTVKLWDPATGSLRRTLDGHSDLVKTVAFSPDGQTVASGSFDKTVKLWDATTGSLRRTSEGHSDLVKALAFSPDGQTVASGSLDKTIKLWNAATGSLLETTSTTDYVYALYFTEDGTALRSNRGRIRSSFLSKHPSTSCQKVPAYISVQGSWTSYHEINILWLPPEYRTDIVEVSRSKVALGRPTGIVTFIEIDVTAFS